MRNFCGCEQPFFLFCGPNVLQGREHALRLADRIARVKHERKLEVRQCVSVRACVPLSFCRHM